ncbi:hypothetical protein [Thermoclostridium stercorarium]|uniref:hypothetical protein n=1 Tax=Thermoclostridium stercorarium TaxID=1510 RepID=UPI000AC21A5D|nr:hypothetical protein [Thermoclostridium stercorarium]
MPWTTVQVEKLDNFFIKDDTAGDRILTYKDALHEALDQSLARIPGFYHGRRCG